MFLETSGEPALVLPLFIVATSAESSFSTSAFHKGLNLGALRLAQVVKLTQYAIAWRKLVLFEIESRGLDKSV